MTRPDSPSDDESPVTEGAPTAAAFAETIFERMAQQDAAQKATTEQLAAIAAILAPLAGGSGDPATTVRKQLFDTYRTASAGNPAKEHGEDDSDAQVDEEQPRNRRRVQVILARPSSSSDEEEDKQVHDSREYSSNRTNESIGSEGSNDLRNKLRRKSQTSDRTCDSHGDLRATIEKSKARKIEDSSVRPRLRPRVIDLREKLNSNLEDLRIKLNSKSEDLRIKLNRPNIQTYEEESRR
ncbi:hypothetical protein IGI04_025997 [Brassica rapa subsp. trilocularis]|uniref:NPH3 domain-containing protein n=1 Tax=Brassica rapa subsp. trilocularis TaxID=1813537 RepID=A0ABQ7KXE9_BRACM|nr:hypothetical protein IGI04_025997 [Brassica rapa subsp. trilocularis]